MTSDSLRHKVTARQAGPEKTPNADHPTPNVEVTWIRALGNRRANIPEMIGCVPYNRRDSARLLDYSV